jgi:hypothetical protein
VDSVECEYINTRVIRPESEFLRSRQEVRAAPGKRNGDMCVLYSRSHGGGRVEEARWTAAVKVNVANLALGKARQTKGSQDRPSASSPLSRNCRAARARQTLAWTLDSLERYR